MSSDLFVRSSKHIPEGWKTADDYFEVVFCDGCGMIGVPSDMGPEPRLDLMDESVDSYDFMCRYPDRFAYIDAVTGLMCFRDISPEEKVRAIRGLYDDLRGKGWFIGFLMNEWWMYCPECRKTMRYGGGHSRGWWMMKEGNRIKQIFKE